MKILMELKTSSFGIRTLASAPELSSNFWYLTMASRNLYIQSLWLSWVLACQKSSCLTKQIHATWAFFCLNNPCSKYPSQSDVSKPTTEKVWLSHRYGPRRNGAGKLWESDFAKSISGDFSLLLIGRAQSTLCLVFSYLPRKWPLSLSGLIIRL